MGSNPILSAKNQQENEILEKTSQVFQDVSELYQIDLFEFCNTILNINKFRFKLIMRFDKFYKEDEIIKAIRLKMAFWTLTRHGYSGDQVKYLVLHKLYSCLNQKRIQDCLDDWNYGQVLKLINSLSLHNVSDDNFY